jgi:hypothetical protein
MTRIAMPFALLTTTLALALPAQATSLTRTFVSSAGNDSNPCTITQPCATFAHAYSLTAADGIIAALDPGKYGPLTITGAITINGYGWAAITAPAAGDGIIINAGATDQVTLTGLEIDGANAGYNGIHFNSGASLTVTNCVLQNFKNAGDFTTGNGIFMAPTSGTVDFTITGTTASNNGYAGIQYLPSSGSASAKAVVDHVVATANHFGIGFSTALASSGTLLVSISNSIASNNQAGIEVNNGGAATTTGSIDNVSVIGNSVVGIDANSTVNLLLGRSVIAGNATGIQNSTSPNTFFSYQNNQIDLNVTDITGTTLNTKVLQ